MEYIYAAMLLHKAGKEVTEDAVKKVLEAAGVQADGTRIKALVAALDGVDIEKAIEKAAVAAPVVAAPSEDVAQAPAEESKKETPKAEEKNEEQAAAGLGALFG